MHHVTARTLAALSAACLGLAASPKTRAGVTYTDLYTLGTPAGFSSLLINGYPAASAGQVVASGRTGTNDHALLWNNSGTPIDLNPSGFTQSDGEGVSIGGGQQVGYGLGPATGGAIHALLWTGSNAAIDLNPPGFVGSLAYGAGEGFQVGGGSPTSGTTHALLWNGTNAAIDLGPTGFLSSTAIGVGGGYQVGSGYGSATNNNTHALLWHGTNVVTDLNPSGFAYSIAFGVSGGQQAGYGYGNATGGSGKIHALLWNGTNVATDLNPASGFTSSYALAISDGREVGYGTGSATGNMDNALFWSGSSGSYINLQSVLPSTFVSSQAYSIVGSTVYGIATDSSGNYHAIEWDGLPAATPEPTSIVTVGLAGAGLLGRRRRA